MTWEDEKDHSRDQEEVGNQNKDTFDEEKSHWIDTAHPDPPHQGGGNLF